MKLTPAETTAMLNALVAAFPNRGKMRILLANPPVARNVDLIASPGTIDVEYFQIVQAANDQGWIDTLFIALRGMDPVNPALIALMDGFVGMRPPAAVQPHLELVLDGTPFVNQHPLRTALQAMTQPMGGPKVLNVTGERAAGKSYSQYLIAHVARHAGAEVYIAPTLETTTTARDVVEDLALFLDLGPVPIPPDQPQDTTAISRMVRWLAATGRKLQTDWWLVFDGFDSPKVDDSVVMLMSGLAQSIGVGQPERLRLFLLAWDRAISGPPPGRVFEQGLLAFDRGHLKAYVDELVLQFSMPSDFASTDEIVALCYEGWDAATDPLDRATTLTRRIQKVAEAAIAGRKP